MPIRYQGMSIGVDDIGIDVGIGGIGIVTSLFVIQRLQKNSSYEAKKRKFCFDENYIIRILI